MIPIYLYKNIFVDIIYMKLSILHFVVFWLFMMCIQYTQMVTYGTSYLSNWSDITGYKYNFGKSYQDMAWLIANTLGYVFICYYLYILRFKYQVSIAYLFVFNSFWYAHWDAVPILMLEGYKHWQDLLFDCVFAGGVWMLAIPIFERFYPLLKNMIPLLALVYCITFFLFFYMMYDFNRKGNEDNFVLKTGDKLGAKTLLSYLSRFNF